MPLNVIVVGLEPLLGTVTLVRGVPAPIVLEKVTLPVPGIRESDWAPLMADNVILEFPVEVSTLKLEPAPKAIVPVVFGNVQVLSGVVISALFNNPSNASAVNPSKIKPVEAKVTWSAANAGLPARVEL